MGFITRFLSTGIRTSAIVHLVMSDLIEIGPTDGESMVPTLAMSRDWVMIDKTFKNGRGIQMGDIIVAKKPTVYNESICKRITGMPGDIILLDPSENTIKNLTYSIENENKVVDENNNNDDISGGVISSAEIKEIRKESNYYDQYIIIPEGHCWVTGDNLSASFDSRSYSTIPLGLIQGKIKYAYHMPLRASQFWESLKDFRRLYNNFTDEFD